MSEAAEQIAVIQYCDVRGIPVYHIPNERKASSRSVVRLKKQGLRPGVPDLCIPIPKGSYGALYIELKAKGGRITEAQKQWIELLRKCGNYAAVCYGADNAIRLIELYLGL